MILLLVAGLLDPAALWHEARAALDEQGDRVVAEAALARLVADHPHAPEAERARRTLVWLRKVEPGRVGVLDDPAREAWLAAHTNAPNAALVACHLAATRDEAGAQTLLGPYRNDARWGWLVEREWNRRAGYARWLRGKRMRFWGPMGGGALLLVALVVVVRRRRRG
jgi:hypothetical protein